MSKLTGTAGLDAGTNLFILVIASLHGPLRTPQGVQSFFAGDHDDEHLKDRWILAHRTECVWENIYNFPRMCADKRTSRRNEKE